MPAPGLGIAPVKTKPFARCFYLYTTAMSLTCAHEPRKETLRRKIDDPHHNGKRPGNN